MCHSGPIRGLMLNFWPMRGSVSSLWHLSGLESWSRSTLSMSYTHTCAQTLIITNTRHKLSLIKLVRLSWQLDSSGFCSPSLLQLEWVTMLLKNLMTWFWDAPCVKPSVSPPGPSYRGASGAWVWLWAGCCGSRRFLHFKHSLPSHNQTFSLLLNINVLWTFWHFLSPYNRETDPCL